MLTDAQKKEIAEAKKELESSFGGNNVDIKNAVKDVGRDLETGKEYAIQWLSMRPIRGLTHWFSADKDVTDDGRKLTLPRTCCTNGMFKNGAKVVTTEVCPACWAGQYQSEYFEMNGELPPDMIPVDWNKHQGKPMGPTKDIYYYARLGDITPIKEKDAQGNVTMGTEITWWAAPTVLKIRPAIAKILADYVGNIDYAEGDITRYLWKMKIATGDPFKKYQNTSPMRDSKGSLVMTSEEDLAIAPELIAILPTEAQLVGATSVEEMEKLLNLTTWGKNANATPPPATPKAAPKTTTKTTTKAPAPEKGVETVYDVDADVGLDDVDDLDGLPF